MIPDTLRVHFQLFPFHTSVVCLISMNFFDIGVPKSAKAPWRVLWQRGPLRFFAIVYRHYSICTLSVCLVHHTFLLFAHYLARDYYYYKGNIFILYPLFSPSRQLNNSFEQRLKLTSATGHHTELLVDEAAREEVLNFDRSREVWLSGWL